MNRNETKEPDYIDYKSKLSTYTLSHRCETYINNSNEL